MRRRGILEIGLGVAFYAQAVLALPSLGAGWHRADRQAPTSCPPPELARRSPMIPPSLARPVREGPGLPERKMPPPDQSPIFLAAACWNVPFLLRNQRRASTCVPSPRQYTQTSGSLAATIPNQRTWRAVCN